MTMLGLSFIRVEIFSEGIPDSSKATIAILIPSEGGGFEERPKDVVKMDLWSPVLEILLANSCGLISDVNGMHDKKVYSKYAPRLSSFFICSSDKCYGWLTSIFSSPRTLA